MKTLIALSFLLSAAFATEFYRPGDDPCPPLPHVPHTQPPKRIGVGLGSYVYFKCDAPYSIIFPEKRYKGKTRCEGTFGKLVWNNVPTCVACGNPGAPADGFISSDNADNDYFGVGEKVTWKCDYGFDLDGASSATCLYAKGSTSWSKPVPECIPIVCFNPGPLQDGSVTPKGPIEVGDSYNYDCDYGFRREGPSSGECQSSGGLDPKNLPTCVPITCSNPGPLTNGKVSPKGPIRPGKSYYYTCDYGFERDGPASGECQSSGDLDPSNLPDCIPITCSNPGPLTNGKVSPKGPIRPGKSYYYTCDYGFERDGPASGECQSSGDLDPSNLPQCIRTCSNPGPLTNGKVSPKGPIRPGISYYYTCDYGFVRDGPASGECQSSGDLDPSNLPRCIPITCSNPGPLTNGKVTPKGPISPGKSYYYTCDYGFVRDGPASGECQSSGDLDPSNLPRCIREEVKCKNPGAPSNGGINPDKTYYGVGEHITFCCNPSYDLRGTSKSTCTKSGTWHPSIRVKCYRYYGFRRGGFGYHVCKNDGYEEW